MNNVLFDKVIEFIRVYKSPDSRLGLDYKKYKNWGIFVRTIAEEYKIKVPNMLCPRYEKLKKEYGSSGIEYYSCVNNKNNTCVNYICSFYEILINLYLYYGYWFWQNIISSEDFIKILNNIWRKYGRF